MVLGMIYYLPWNGSHDSSIGVVHGRPDRVARLAAAIGAEEDVGTFLCINLYYLVAGSGAAFGAGEKSNRPCVPAYNLLSRCWMLSKAAVE